IFARHKLKTCVHVVLYRAVPVEVVDTLRSLSRDDQNVWIHDTRDGVSCRDFHIRPTSRGLGAVDHGTSSAVGLDTIIRITAELNGHLSSAEGSDEIRNDFISLDICK
ncbi:hypothetical protein JG687_00012541, partial [Phytophthora cactorum]